MGERKISAEGAYFSQRKFWQQVQKITEEALISSPADRPFDDFNNPSVHALFNLLDEYGFVHKGGLLVDSVYSGWNAENGKALPPTLSISGNADDPKTIVCAIHLAWFSGKTRREVAPLMLCGSNCPTPSLYSGSR
ncbi:hypothetical protein OVA10_11265 [Lelliottia sp. SL45]|uniref:hypothetical protein n=1 Tax=Lelliottia TaxID=1330545 RepID=UPI00192BE08B|nr:MULTISPECIES: hypothetical protein [Lelliottia]MBL5920649.1 hypothetical protein [Lelliottia amnigena]MCY1698623.1 hypothetical protein [Lelliottia sp. SL45]